VTHVRYGPEDELSEVNSDFSFDGHESSENCGTYMFNNAARKSNLKVKKSNKRRSKAKPGKTSTKR